MRSATKSDRIDLRLTKQHKEDIEYAAALSGRSVTDFSVSVLVREANEVIQRERDLAISREALAAFHETIDRPARPIKGLADLLARPNIFEN